MAKAHQKRACHLGEILVGRRRFRIPSATGVLDLRRGSSQCQKIVLLRIQSVCFLLMRLRTPSLWDEEGQKCMDRRQ